jgi:hypothetical protein
MQRTSRMALVLLTLTLSIAASAVAGLAAPTGVQLSPDGRRRVVNKDVGEER